MVEARLSDATEKVIVVEDQPAVVVGIPAFNEEKTIGRIVIESQKYASKVIVCDDGSTDLTGEIARRVGADVVRHERNLGYGAAIRSLFKRAEESGADILITLDGDGQHDPRQVARVMTPLIDDEADLVIGSRFVDGHLARTMPWYRRAGVKFITKLVDNNSKSGVKDGQSGFRAYNRRALEALDMAENGMGVSTEVLMNAQKQGLRICEVPITCSYGGDVKTSTHHPVKHGASVVMSIVKLIVEDRPLILMGIPGIVCLMTGVIFGVWMLQIYAVEREIVTNIALASLAFMMIGFFCLSTAITLYAISRLAQRTKRQ